MIVGKIGLCFSTIYLLLFSYVNLLNFIIKTAYNSTFEKLKMAFSLVLKLKYEVAIFNFTNLQNVISYQLTFICKHTTKFFNKKIFLLKITFYICFIKL